MNWIRQATVAAILAGVLVHGAAAAQDSSTAQAVRVAAEKYAGGIAWQASSVLTGDFTCGGAVQQAILGASPIEIVVAIFTHGLQEAPTLLRFDADERNIVAAKIRLDDYNLSAAEIASVAGTAPIGYRPSTSCHGVRLSDDSSEAAHIYWDHTHQHFDTWTQ